LPEGWALGPDGQPTTDPEAALAGAQLPFGGYKGAALALMVELLASALVGDVFSFEASARDNKDVSGDARAGQLARAEQLFAMVLEQDGTRLPSDRRYAARLITPTKGISIPASLFATLQELQTS
jgi:LDH2 family malate/lactate/ureidoglycolate dehydrogenase